MLTTTHDNEEIIERVAALDIGKAELMCCVRVPDGDHPGSRLQEVQAYPAMTRSVLGLADDLGRLGVTRVAMAVTSARQQAPSTRSGPVKPARPSATESRPCLFSLGGYAEYAVASIWTRKPDTVSWVDAGALPSLARPPPVCCGS
jgi:hypothetical protein